MLQSCPLSGVHGVTLRDKVRGCEIRKTLNVESPLRIERSHAATLVRPSVQNALEKNGEAVLLATISSYGGKTLKS